VTILALGLSHHTAPLDVRERLAYASDALGNLLTRARGRLMSDTALEELVVLSTCNRVEVYAAARDKNDDGDPWIAVEDVLAESLGFDLGPVRPFLVRRRDEEAVRHLCRVAAGLESMVLGESEILGQVAEAQRLAAAAEVSGPTLTALFQAAVKAGKRARTETAVGRNPASVSSVAVCLASNAAGPLEGLRVAVLGAGHMGVKAVTALRAQRAGDIVVLNRSVERARDVAARWGGTGLGLDRLEDTLAWADIAICSTGAPHLVVTREALARAVSGRSGRPLVLFDIAIPRDVDAAVRDLPAVRLYDLDDINARLSQTVDQRRLEVPRVEAIVSEEAAAFEAWVETAGARPLLSELRQGAEAARRRELDRFFAQFPDLDAATRQGIERLSRALTNSLLARPTDVLRNGANGRTAAIAAAARDLFGLKSAL